ncbi:PREDICTED: Down syndrome critical region protein 3 homolog [Nicrophorus vespilloides]|uniref:Down syndrome critical region protein 3 homolog n=1 Tax=Nicrophorus vespilloides TaxID=110193 RepID=A0ABM1MKR0_NICVS|nr:PREDICTED: Down syndrome critical region protein 3 homolog [Nicrophorus vespilloides]
MSVTLDIRLKKADKVYTEGEKVTGFIVVKSNSDLKHDGITLSMEGSVNLQLSSKNVGILEAFYNSVKPIQLVYVSCEVVSSGKLPSGTTEIPFELPLMPKQNRELYETYHGVFINISYSLKCDMKRSFLSKDLQKVQQFMVQYKQQKTELPRPVSFKISPQSLASGSSAAPDFLIRGKMDSTRCSVAKPLTGFLVLEKCAKPIRSVELQLVRVETCGCAEGYSRDATEIQNIQIGDGDIPQNIEIPIYMIFPRLFTCPTMIKLNFKIEFEINIVVVFQDDHLVTENFPILLTRE